jgi:hypothetical protein
MPDVSATGFKTHLTAGFGFLKNNKGSLDLSFSGTTLPGTLDVGFYNDEGDYVPFNGSVVSALPTSYNVNTMPEGGVVINVDGGSPDFNVSPASPFTGNLNAY